MASAALITGYTTRTTCRVCNSSDLTDLFSLGAQYVSAFIDTAVTPADAPKAPIDLVQCAKCSLVQLRHTAPQELLYRRYYWYRSGVTATMRAALKDITQAVQEKVTLQNEDVVLDIGSNDGTLLRSYEQYPYDKLLTVGVEPADNLVELGSEGVDVFIHDFWNYDLYEQAVGRKAKVITAIGMFYDLEDPNQFIADIAKALAPDGVFVAQLMCLQNMLNLGDVGNFAHEHLEYYTLRSLYYLLGKYNLELFDIETNDVNGQSYRLWIRHRRSRPDVVSSPSAQNRIRIAWEAEESLWSAKYGTDVYDRFFTRMEENKRLTVDFINSQVAQGKRCWVYGASTKGNVILQYYGLDSSIIQGASDRSPEKWGKYTVGSGIPIYSEEKARKANPDFFLVLPYAFLDEFVKREHLWWEGGGKFIVPLPEFRVV